MISPRLVAIAAQAKGLVFLTDSGGLLDASGKLVESVNAAQVDELIDQKIITGGMIVKARASIDASRRGVEAVYIVKDLKNRFSRIKNFREGLCLAPERRFHEHSAADRPLYPEHL